MDPCILRRLIIPKRINLCIVIEDSFINASKIWGIFISNISYINRSLSNAFYYFERCLQMINVQNVQVSKGLLWRVILRQTLNKLYFQFP